MDFLFTLFPSVLKESDWISSLQSFMTQGGQILWWLAVVVAICWLFIIERILYLTIQFPRQRRAQINAWHKREEQHSWYALAIRESWLCQSRIQLYQNLNIIKLLVAICPMLGLLGTVTGMISVFDVMANQGSSDPKLMASGISLATLPTMAGMVAALAGMFAHARLTKACMVREVHLEKSLRSQK